MKYFLQLSLVVSTLFFTINSALAVQKSDMDTTPGKYILVLNKSADTAWQIDAETGEKVTEYPTGKAPHEVAVSPDLTRAVITNYGAESAGHTLTLINLSDRTVEKTIDLQPYSRPHGVEWFRDGERVVVSTEAQQSVLIVNTETGEILKSIKTDQQTSHMVELGPDEQRVYVPNIGSGTVSVLNIVDEEIVKTLETGSQTEGITLANGGNELWVTNRGANTVSVINTETLEIEQTFGSSDFPIRAEVSPDGRYVAVTNARSSQVKIFNPNNREAIASISTLTENTDNGVPIGLVFSDDSSRLYISNSNANQVVVLDTANWEIIDTYATGETPDGIAFFTAPTQ